MLNQWGAQRTCHGPQGRRIGTVPVGTIVYIQDGIRPFGLDPHRQIIRRDPWQVEAWIPREVPEFDLASMKYRMVRRCVGHLAQVRSLRTGRRQEVADWSLLACIDAGLEKL